MRTILLILFGAILGILLLPYVVIRQPKMPEGTSLRSLPMPYRDAELLIDRTAYDADKKVRVISHTIFDVILEEIASAETFLVVDFFLWNPWKGAIDSGESMPELSTRLANALIAKRESAPDLPMMVITDPINRIYSDRSPEFFDRMVQAGIPVVFTDLSRLPDSNRIYAPQARFWGQIFGSEDDVVDEVGGFPNPFQTDGDKITASAFFKLLYFKANHRKVLISGRAGAPNHLIVGSLNPADGSGFHSNMAVRVVGPVADYAAASELSIAEWSSQDPGQVHYGEPDLLKDQLVKIRRALDAAIGDAGLEAEDPSVTWISEGAVQRALIEAIDQAGAGAQIDCAIFYFSDRKIVNAMKAAIERGVEFRILMDVNRDAFGREKIGIPNREVAAELMSTSGSGQVNVRWAVTHGEQFHTKAFRLRSASEDLLILGSANWTRRNIGDLNLEANLLFRHSGELGEHFDHYFESIWSNQSRYEESQSYDVWAESGWGLTWKTWVYRFQEWSGMSTF